MSLVARAGARAGALVSALVWGLWLPLAAAMLAGADAELLSLAGCAAAHEAGFAYYVGLSGWWSRYLPRDFRSDKYWADVAASIDRLGGGLVGEGSPETSGTNMGTSTAWLAHVMEGATARLEECRLLGGRFWEGEIEAPRPQSGGAGAAGPAPAPPPLRSSLCAPKGCGRRGVEVAVLPRLFRAVLGGGAGLPLEGRAVELTSWSDLALDFVLVGVGGCGTTSLRQNLGRHPDVGFSNNSVVYDEDFFFTSNLGFRTLPPKAQVNKFNRRRLKDGQRPPSFGLYHGRLWTENLHLHAFASMPDVLVVVIVCDPVDRFEKEYFRAFCGCGYSGKGVARAAGEHLARCRRSILNILRDHGPASPGGEFKPGLWHYGRLRMLRQLFGDRLLVLHQGWLHQSPRDVFGALADFLGVAPLPSGFELQRYNSVPGLRSGLCQNASLLRYVRRRLRSEYAAVEEAARASLASLGGGAALGFRFSRCDRPEALAPSPCEFPFKAVLGAR